MKENILVVLLAITTIGLTGFVCYDKLLKEEEKVVCEKCPECEICPSCETADVENEDNSFKINSREQMGISFNDDSFVLYGYEYDNNLKVKFYTSEIKALSNMKIKEAKILYGLRTSDEVEEAVIVMQDGSVYAASYNITNNNIEMEKVEKLTKYNVNEVINVRTTHCGGPDFEDVKDMCGTRWLVRLKGENNLKIILDDGTTKLFTGDSNSDNW